MTIVGAGSTQTVIGWASGAQQDRVFHIEVLPSDTANISVSIQGVTIENGYVPAPAVLDDSIPTATVRFSRMGGGIAIGPGAEIQVIDATLPPEESEEGGDCGGGGHGSRNGCAGPEGHGGPGESESGATIQLVSLSDVRILSNHAGGEGGGIYNTGPISIDHAVIAGNSSDINGGGIYNDGAMSLTDSTIGTLASPNSALNGGGVFETGFHTSVIEDDTFAGNTATSGAAIAGRRMVLDLITRSTIADNSASDAGGGITTNGRVTLNDDTVADNVISTAVKKGGAGLHGFGPSSAQPAGGNANAANFNLTNTIVAGNTINASPAVLANCGGTGEGDPAARFYSLGHNLEDGNSCNFLAAGDQTGVDPMLGPLADNGGPTQTMALSPASSAVNAGDDAACTNLDQRGQPGHADGRLDGTFTCDIGAFELFVESADLHIDDMSAPDTVYIGDPFQVTVTAHVDPAATAPSTGVQIFMEDPLPSALTLSSASVSTPSGTGTCAESAGTVSCDAGTLAPGQSATMTLSLTAGEQSSVDLLSAGASETSPVDPNPGNNAAQVQVAVLGKSDLSIEPAGPFGVAMVGLNTPIPFQIHNSGPSTATNVRVGVFIPSNMAYQSIDLPGASCSYDGSSQPPTVQCVVDSLAAGQTLGGSLVATSVTTATGDVTFAVDAPQQDVDLVNNQAEVSLTAEPAAAATGGGGCTTDPGSGFDPTLLCLVLLGLAGRLTMRGNRARRR